MIISSFLKTIFDMQACTLPANLKTFVLFLLVAVVFWLFIYYYILCVLRFIYSPAVCCVMMMFHYYLLPTASAVLLFPPYYHVLFLLRLFEYEKRRDAIRSLYSHCTLTHWLEQSTAFNCTFLKTFVLHHDDLLRLPTTNKTCTINLMNTIFPIIFISEREDRTTQEGQHG